MNQPTCVTHGPVTGFEARKVWSFTEDDALEGMASVLLSCGCLHEGVTTQTDYLDDRKITTLTYYTGEPIITYVSSYDD
ncbi:hypothetical protein ACQPZK_07625 [Micromonospora sp. CA-249363]|uniref:hypothetical protein n=1 Tax=Micromonospora sp. CA-249363 TaxID=3239963 RepID=UPI003D91FF29